MTTSDSQKRFNQYPVRAFVRDIWHGSSKDEKRIEASALIDAYLREGGEITKAPAKKRKSGRPEVFTKDTHAVKAHEKWNRKFYAGDDFCQRGPRFTSKPISEKAIDQRDTERKAGVSHSEFTGAVTTDINGKLQPRNAPHTADEALVDMVSKGGSEKVVQLFADTKDDLSDANRRATIRDELNLTGTDYAHNSRFKLAA